MATDVDRIAASFLKALRAPNTPAMRAAVKAWLRAEGISSVKRNNPWNLHQGPACGGANDTGKFCPRNALPGQIGVVNVAPGDRNVAVFKTLDAGVAANANNLVRLSNSGYGYDRVVKYARAGDPVMFLHALARSSWSFGRYGTRDGGKNKLILYYNDATGQNADPKGYLDYDWGRKGTGNKGGGNGGKDGPGNADSTNYNSDSAFVRALRAYLAAHPEINPATDKVTADQFWDAVGNLPGFKGMRGDKNSEAEMIASWFVGRSWSDVIGAASEGMSGNNPDAIAALADFITKLSNPGTWARILALIGGAAMVAYGAVNIYRATG